MYQILTNKEEKKEYEIQEQQVSIGRIMVSFTINVFFPCTGIKQKILLFHKNYTLCSIEKKKTNSKSVIH